MIAFRLKHARLNLCVATLMAVLATPQALLADEDAAQGDSPTPNTVDSKQSAWYEKYKKQENIPKPEAMLLNTAKEPNVKNGFKQLFNGTDLSGWTPRGGKCKFEVVDGMVVGTCVPGEPSTYLSSDKSDYKDFVFTCDMKWEEDGNSGVMFRAQVKESDKGAEIVFGPQAEMEGISGDRYWSGGIYGQSCGGYFYPLWLTGHEDARQALKRDDWNRLTVKAKGKVVRTWINGVPCALWKGDGTYSEGFFGLQIHKGTKGKVLWKNARVKELSQDPKKAKVRKPLGSKQPASVQVQVADKKTGDK